MKQLVLPVSWKEQVTTATIAQAIKEQYPAWGYGTLERDPTFDRYELVDKDGERGLKATTVTVVRGKITQMQIASKTEAGEIRTVFAFVISGDRKKITFTVTARIFPAEIAFDDDGATEIISFDGILCLNLL